MNGLRSRAYSTALSNGKPLEWKDMRQSHIGHLSTGSYGQINKRDISCMHILQMSLLPVSKNIFKDVSSTSTTCIVHHVLGYMIGKCSEIGV